MKRCNYDVLVIGGGAAGMGAASTIAEKGHTVSLIEREPVAGGILNQCIHNGFGLKHYDTELTGPEYAERQQKRLESLPVDIHTGTTAVDIEADTALKKVYTLSAEHGMIEFSTRAVVLAMGCRERNRGNIGTPGSRPAGVYTAGLAQRLVNIDGYIPGRECVIIGSGDIGLIMARRMKWIGAQVKAVVEMLPDPSGLTRNIVQCLHDFNIPLYLSHVVTAINGRDRVEGVTIAPISDGHPDDSTAFTVTCDSVLLSVGLIPENELSRLCGIHINHDTGGARVDSCLMTSVDGIFACGNVLHVHDLVDYVTEESHRCGLHVSRYLTGESSGYQYPVVAGSNVKYIIPNRYSTERDTPLYLRSMITDSNASLLLRRNGVDIFKSKRRHVQPSEMIQYTVSKEMVQQCDRFLDNNLEVHIVPGKTGTS